MSTSERTRIAFVATHPIQHFCPQYRSLAADPGIDVLVLFWTMRGLEPYEDPDFDRTVTWGQDLVDGFASRDLAGSRRAARDALDDFDPDWVITYGYRTPAARSAWRWAYRKREVGLAYIADSELRHAESLTKRTLKLLAMRVLFKRVDAFLTVGDANEAYYRAAGVPSDRFVRMHFPIELQTPTGPAKGLEIREHLGIPTSAVVVLNVGKLIARKRQADLIDSAARFGGRDLHLISGGQWPNEPALRDRAKDLDNVTFAGFVSPKALPALYRAADVYAHVSDLDPHPLAVSEAGAAGCALVASTSIGSWGTGDDVRPGVTGLVFATGDVDALTEAFSQFVRDRQLMTSFAEASRRVSHEHQSRAHGGFVPDMITRSPATRARTP